MGNGKKGGILAIAGYYYPKLVVNSVRGYGFVWMCRVVVYRKNITDCNSRLMETIFSRSWV